MIDPALFDQLKENIEKDGSIRKDLEKIIEELNQHVSYTQGVLTKIHSTPRSKCTVLQPNCVLFHLPTIRFLQSPSQTVFYPGTCGMRRHDHVNGEFIKV